MLNARLSCKIVGASDPGLISALIGLFGRKWEKEDVEYIYGGLFRTYEHISVPDFFVLYFYPHLIYEFRNFLCTYGIDINIRANFHLISLTHQ